MNLNNPAINNLIQQDKRERRAALQLELPFITEEGMVMIDRRAKKIEKSTLQKVVGSASTDIPMFDTHFTIDKL